MKRIIILIFWFLGSVNACYSCSCVMGKVDIQLYTQTEIIFIGKIIKVVNNKALAENQITFEIIERFKGLSIGKKTFNVNTQDSGGMCGISGKVGEKWLIWAHARNGLPYTDICTHSNLLSRVREDLEILKSFKENGDHNWFQNGTLVANGQLIDKIPIGKWKFFKIGKITSEGDFVEGKKDGDWVFYSSTGDKYVKSSSAKYKNGEYVSSTSFYENGNPSKFKRHYGDTGLVDMEIEYYKEGKVRKRITYKDNKVFSDISYYEDGKIAINRQYKCEEIPNSYRIYDRQGNELDTYAHHINLNKETGILEVF